MPNGAKHDPAQFYDVDYSADPDPIRRSRTSTPRSASMVTDEAPRGHPTTDAQSQAGSARPKHTYSLADYGLTAEQVKERFAGL